MARQLRMEYAGAIYHVMNRGDRREAIFHDDAVKGADLIVYPAGGRNKLADMERLVLSRFAEQTIAVE